MFVENLRRRKNYSLDWRFNGTATIDTGVGKTKVVHLKWCKVLPNDNSLPHQPEQASFLAAPNETDENPVVGCADGTESPNTQTETSHTKSAGPQEAVPFRAVTRSRRVIRNTS